MSGLSRFGLSFGFGWSDVDKNWHSEAKFDLILTRNHASACHSDPAGPMWTKIGTVKQLDPGNKPFVAFLQNLQI